MTNQFLRDFRLTVGRNPITEQTSLLIAARPEGDTLQVRPTLRVQFEAEATGERFTNSCSLSIYNLGRNHRAFVERPRVLCILEAGYVGHLKRIFTGDLRRTLSVKDNVDWISKIEIADGGKQYSESRVQRSFPAGTFIAQIAIDIAETMGIGIGNLREVLAAGGFRNAGGRVPTGFVASGKSADQLERVLAPLGLKWSLQNGVLEVTNGLQSLRPEKAILFSKETGMIGSPTVGEDGILRAKKLLDGDVRPNRLVEVRSLTINAFYRVARVVYKGDTWGQDWFVQVEGIPV